MYTRKGDAGTTSLYSGVRVEKDDPGIEVCGSIDELSASLGMVRTEGLPPQFEPLIVRIQQELISFCTDIVSGSATISPEHIWKLESEIDRMAPGLPPLSQFIIPGDNRISAMLHLSRTICRRAERRLVTLFRTRHKLPHLVVYLNRLSDLLFVMARKVSETVPQS